MICLESGMLSRNRAFLNPSSLTMIQVQPITLYLSNACANSSIGIVAALNQADPGRLATEDLNLVNNASTGRPGSSYRRNTGKDDASELEEKTSQGGRQNSLRCLLHLLARCCSDEEYDSSRVTVVNK